MSHNVKVVVGETLAKIRFYLTEKDRSGVESPVDLTGCSLQAKYSINGGLTKTMNLTPSVPYTDGIAEGQSVLESWDVPGIAKGRIYITSGPLVGYSEEWMLEVQKQ